MKLELINDFELTKNYIDQALQLDYESYPDEYHISKEQCLSYIHANNNIYFMLVDTHADKLIGYLNFTPLTEQAYNKIKCGDSIDSALSEKDILPYSENHSEYFGYFSSIVIDKAYRKCGYYKLLLDSLFDFIVELSSKGIYIKKILADVLSFEGEKVMQRIGLTKVENMAIDSNIMEMIMIPHSFDLTSENKKIYDAYKTL